MESFRSYNWFVGDRAELPKHTFSVALAALLLTACATTSHFGVGSSRDGKVDDGVIVYSRLTREDAITRLRLQLDSAGYVIDRDRSSNSKIQTAPALVGTERLTLIVQLMPTSYPEGHQTLLVFSGTFSDPNSKSKQLNANTQPDLWAKVKSVAAQYKTAEVSLP